MADETNNTENSEINENEIVTADETTTTTPTGKKALLDSLGWFLAKINARTIKIGSSTAKQANGNLTYTVSEIGAAASSHKHAYADLSGVAASNHNHNTVYSNISHKHVFADLDGVAASGHKHSRIINNYFKDDKFEMDVCLTNHANFVPRKKEVLWDNGIDLGNESGRWIQVYSVKGTLSTSDRNEKIEIEDLSEKYERMYMDLRPVTYMWKQFEGERKHDRIHCGLIAQEVNEAANKNGLTKEEFGGICRDDLETPTSDGRTERWGLRYDEFHAITISMVQKATRNIEALEKRVAALEEENITLRALIDQK